MSCEDAAFLSVVITTLSSDSLTALADQLDRLLEIAFGFFNRLLDIREASPGEGAELLDAFHQCTHNCSMGIGLLRYNSSMGVDKIRGQAGACRLILVSYLMLRPHPG